MTVAGFVITSTKEWAARTALTSQRIAGAFLIIHSVISIAGFYTDELAASPFGIAFSILVGVFLALGYLITVPILLCMIALGVLRSTIQAFDQQWDPVIFSALSTPGYLLLLLGRPTRRRIYTGAVLLVVHMLLYAAVVIGLLTGGI
jgi:hypothetical protein